MPRGKSEIILYQSFNALLQKIIKISGELEVGDLKVFFFVCSVCICFVSVHQGEMFPGAIILLIRIAKPNKRYFEIKIKITAVIQI